MKKTWKMISDGKQSVLRIGDGELRWMSGDPLSSFEKNNDRLQSALMTAVNVKDSRLLVCVNGKLLLRRLNHAPEYIKSYYKAYVAKNWKLIIRSIPKFRWYGDACISHFYRETDGLPRSRYLEHFEIVKQTWRGKHVLIVEGEDCKFGVGNDLLESAASVRRVLCPNRNSFSLINRISEEIEKRADQFDICLFVLGPTATVLVSELSGALPNKRFIDIGTLDTDYMLFLFGKKCDCSIQHKTIWGIGQVPQPEICFEFDEKRYNSEVSARICHPSSSDL